MKRALILLLACLGCQPPVTFDPACVDDAGAPLESSMNVPGTNTWPTNVRVIDDGDTCSNAEHGATASDLADRTTYVRDGVPGKAASLAVKVPLAPAENASARFEFSAAYWRQLDVTTAGRLIFPVPTTVKGKITSVTARIHGHIGGVGHAGLPATKPKLLLWRIDPALTLTVVASATDAPANLAAYETAHNLSITGLSAAIVAGQEYFIQFEGETGANSSALDLTLSSIEVTIEP